MRKNNKSSPAKQSRNDFVVFTNWHQAFENDGNVVASFDSIYWTSIQFPIQSLCPTSYNNNSVCMCNYGQSVCANKNYKPKEDVESKTKQQKNHLK